MEKAKTVQRKYSNFEKKEHRQGYLFLTPALIILFIFIGLSVLFVCYLSFQKVNLFTGEYTFVGLKNYERVFTDEVARRGLTNTLMFSVVVVPVQTFLHRFSSPFLMGQPHARISSRPATVRLQFRCLPACQLFPLHLLQILPL